MSSEAPGNHANLDDPRRYASLDPSGLGDRIADLPSQCRRAWEAAAAWAPPQQWQDADQVVIGGMGGSAVAGELAAGLGAGLGGRPILVVREPRLPFPLGRHTLFIACSYSGRTRETLALYDQAVSSGAMTLALSSGGPLAQRAEDSGTPRLTIGLVSEPRSAVGYHLLLLLGVLGRAGLLEMGTAEVEAALGVISQAAASLGREAPTAGNRAKQLALELQDRLVVVYGGGLLAGMARRWKTQLNENAKVWAFFETLPELLHNSVEAYGSGLPVGGLMALLLQGAAGDRDSGIYEGHNRAVLELLGRSGTPHLVVTAEEGPPLAQLLGMLQLGDYVSYYLALLRGVDPAPNPTIDAAKALPGAG